MHMLIIFIQEKVPFVSLNGAVSKFIKINVSRKADQEGKKKKREKESGITVKANLFYLLIYLWGFIWELTTGLAERE